MITSEETNIRIDVSNNVDNVEKRFKELPQKGHSETLHHLKYFSNIGVEHVQGYTQYSKYYILTHNTSGTENGYILSSYSSGNGKKEIIEKYSHPGGIQNAGKYLFVPCEHGAKSHILVYEINDEVEKVAIDFEEFKHRAGCVGITAFKWKGALNYIMLIGDQHNYYAYMMDISDGYFKKEWQPIGSISLANIDQPDKSNTQNDLNCQGIGLVTDENGSVYMIALMTHGTVRDCAYLFKLEVIESESGGLEISYKKIDSRHLISKGGISGSYGSHFRWGAGVFVTSAKDLCLLCTSRNIMAGTILNTCYW